MKVGYTYRVYTEASGQSFDGNSNGIQRLFAVSPH